jgi:serine/threonine protein kinase
LDLEIAAAPHVLRGVFRLEQRIGTGSMAVVYSARDLKLDRTVAIKTLPRISAEAAARLHREARASAAVSHPGLASIHGLETWEGTPLLILEHLEGGTMADRLVEGRLLTSEELLHAARSLAAALDKLHSTGVLHRDIKPSNIGFTADGDAKLLDFGVAMILDSLRRESAFTEEAEAGWSTVWHQERSLTGNTTGTLPYAAPELLRGGSPGPGSDLWALSVVLFEAVSGENLFRGRSLKELVERIREAILPDLDAVLTRCPELVAFFRGALARDVAERPQSGAELVRRLEQAVRAVG